MSAFGRRNSIGNGAGARPGFGVARPMQGGAPARGEADAGDQFPPLDALDLPGVAGAEPAFADRKSVV